MKIICSITRFDMAHTPFIHAWKEISIEQGGSPMGSLKNSIPPDYPMAWATEQGQQVDLQISKISQNTDHSSMNLLSYKTNRNIECQISFFTNLMPFNTCFTHAHTREQTHTYTHSHTHAHKSKNPCICCLIGGIFQCYKGYKGEKKKPQNSFKHAWVFI